METYPDDANTNAQGEGGGPLEESVVNSCEETHIWSGFISLKQSCPMRNGQDF